LTPTLWARSNTALRAFNEGVKEFNAKEYDHAIPFFSDAIEADSAFAEAYFARGACRYFLKSLDGAILDLNAAVQLNPDYRQARALRGAVNYESDQWDAALEDFGAVLKEDPHDAQSLLGRAVILLKRNRLDAAARDFRGFLSVRPNDPLAPRIREILVSLKHAPAEPRAEKDEGETVPEHHVARSPTMENLNHMADGLLNSPLVESYDRKVLRGEKAEAVGDIHSNPSVPRDNQKPDTGVEIIEPK